MSLGVSISDVAMLVKLAWRTVQNTRNADSEHDELRCATLGLHKTLRRLESEVKNPTSLLNKPEDPYRQEIQTIGNGCQKVLEALDKILEKYSSLSGGSRGIPKAWQRFRFGNEEITIKDIRAKMTFYTSALSLYLNMVSVGSSGRVERQMEAAGGDLKEIKTAVNTITAHLMSSAKEEGSQMTAYADDDRAVWREFRRELVKKGFRSSLLHKHKATIQSYVNELGHRGLMDESEPIQVQGPALHDVSEEEAEEQSSLEEAITISPPQITISKRKFVEKQIDDQEDDQDVSEEEPEPIEDLENDLLEATLAALRVKEKDMTESLSNALKEVSCTVPRPEPGTTDTGRSYENASAYSISILTESSDDAAVAPGDKSPSPETSIIQSLGKHRRSASWLLYYRLKAQAAEDKRQQWVEQINRQLLSQRQEWETWRFAQACHPKRRTRTPAPIATGSELCFLASPRGICCVYDGCDVSTLLADFELRVNTLKDVMTNFKTQVPEDLCNRIESSLVEAQSIIFKISAAGLYEYPDNRRSDWIVAHLLEDAGEKMVGGACGWFLSTRPQSPKVFLQQGVICRPLESWQRDITWRRDILEKVYHWLVETFFRFFLDRDSIMLKEITEPCRIKFSGETFKKQIVSCSMSHQERLRCASSMRFLDIQILNSKISKFKCFLDHQYQEAQADEDYVRELETELRISCNNVSHIMEAWPVFPNRRFSSVLYAHFIDLAHWAWCWLHKSAPLPQALDLQSGEARRRYSKSTEIRLIENNKKSDIVHHSADRTLPATDFEPGLEDGRSEFTRSTTTGNLHEKNQFSQTEKSPVDETARSFNGKTARSNPTALWGEFSDPSGTESKSNDRKSNMTSRSAAWGFGDSTARNVSTRPRAKTEKKEDTRSRARERTEKGKKAPERRRTTVHNLPLLEIMRRFKED
ncbi:MAG: hypothetical protein LQ342_005096 [Letrouitia transgressa]|nr:MAG: hypothetical protein LQ342_005096 [Letrouitia transgressa]